MINQSQRESQPSNGACFKFPSFIRVCIYVHNGKKKGKNELIPFNQNGICKTQKYMYPI